jgi:glycosyltransferase involved in cell wall biosynthesis
MTCVEALESVLEQQIPSLEILFVDDGSSDRTWTVIKSLAAERDHVTGIRLTRNVGKELALCAGIAHASGSAHIPFDVDLQDPPEVILEMVQRWRSGAQLVLAKRESRSDGWAKRVTANAFYGVASRQTHVKLPRDVGDFRLMDAKVSERYLRLPERNRFNKGLFALVAPADIEVVEFERPQAVGRKSRQSPRKLLGLAVLVEVMLSPSRSTGIPICLPALLPAPHPRRRGGHLPGVGP